MDFSAHLEAGQNDFDATPQFADVLNYGRLQQFDAWGSTSGWAASWVVKFPLVFFYTGRSN